MRFVKYFLIIAIILAGIGYGIYHFGIKFASDNLMEVVSTELLSSHEMEKIKEVIENDPELKAFIEDVDTVDEQALPFTTKEEATKVVVKKIGINELREIQTKVQQGQVSKEELIQEVENNFTEEEIMALKVIAYKELYQ